MAASSNTTWLKGFSGSPDSAAREEGTFAELVAAIGTERVPYPPGGDDACEMLRIEALGRALWTRAVIDGDMTAIKLLVEQLSGAGGEGESGASMNADTLAAAESVLNAWLQGKAADGTVAVEESTGGANGDDNAAG